MRDSLRKYLAAATLLVLPIIAACGEDVMPPPPTGSIVGQVSIEGMGIDGATVSLSNGASTATAGGGNYRFDNVEQGSYTVTISGFPADASFDATSAPASIGETGGTVTVDFRGTYIRTAAIMGTVTVENMGLGGVTVRLSGMADHQSTTDDSGQYSFTGLRAGTYSVEISGFDTNEVSFSSTSGAATVGVGESKVVSFDGTYLRTASIGGQVTVDGEGLQGVTVTLVGEGEDRTEVTNATGQYAFSQLKSGTYQVAITNPDPEDYEFKTTSKSATIATGEVANVPFEGTLLRTAGISGRVSLDDGMGLDGVTVTLAGAAEATTETSNGGQYSFAGLAAGTYVLSIANPNPAAYNFDDSELSKNVMLEDDQSAIVNFSGTHTRTASVSGVLFIDEVDQNKMHDDGEPSITQAIAPLVAAGALDQAVVASLLANAKVVLRGPDLNTKTDIAIMADGTFSTGAALMAGSYQVELPVNNDDVAAGLAAAGVAFVGESAVVTVEAGGSATVNFPFRITMQTVATGARMGGGGNYGAPVAGVKLALYARADGTDMLGEATTDDMGMASFTFARADNTGPAGNDNIVFVKAMDTGNPALVISGNEFVEIAYASTARLYAADAEKEAATLVNVAVAFDFWVKSNEMARDGDMGLGGWNTLVYMGDPKAAGAMPLMVPDPMDPMKMVNATLPTDTTKGANLGKSTFAYTVDPTKLPAMFTVMVAMDDKVACSKDGKSSDQPDQCEVWEQGNALTFTHTGLNLPPGKDDPMTDLGPLRVTFTTQSLTVGIHRELDDRPGFTDHIGAGGGDDRPTGHAAGQIMVSLMKLDDRGRPRIFKYDENGDGTPTAATKSFGGTGMVTFKNIVATEEIIAVVEPPRNIVTVPNDRYSMELDVYGNHIPTDGVVVGAFGAESGARPDVWLCTLTDAAADATKDCSTFAYKWQDGGVSGNIQKLRLARGEKATVRLVPVSTPYEDDFADETTVTGTGSSTSPYSFSGVADGRYKTMLVAETGKWSEIENTGGVFDVVHDESTTGATAIADGAMTASGKHLDATELRFEIKGRVSNNADGNSSLTRDESLPGVELTIYAATKVGGSSTDKNRYRKAGDAVKTTQTDADGVYMFEGLRPGYYIVEAAAGSNYEVVRERGTSLSHGATGKATDVVSMAVGQAVLPATPPTKPALAQWDYANSNLEVGGALDFALLYTNGLISGVVKDSAAAAMHRGATVRLSRCQTWVGGDSDGDGTDDSGTAGHAERAQANRCSTYDGWTMNDIPVGASGSWFQDDLREGHYEAEVRPPTGYGQVDNTGVVPNPATNGGGNAGTYWVRQVGLVTNSRPRGSMEQFYIARLGANTGTTIATLEVDKVTCATGAGRCDAGGTGGRVPNVHTDGVVSLEVTLDAASAGGTIEVWSGDPAVTPRPATTKRLAKLTDGVAANVTVGKGSTQLWPIVQSANGYSVSASAQHGEVYRDFDTRLNSILVKWNGGSYSVDRATLEAMSNFVVDEEAGTRDIANNTAPTRTPAVTITLPASAAGLALEITYEAMDGATGQVVDDVNAVAAIASGASGNDAAVLVDPDATAAGENTRNYNLTINVP